MTFWLGYVFYVTKIIAKTCIFLPVIVLEASVVAFKKCLNSEPMTMKEARELGENHAITRMKVILG